MLEVIKARIESLGKMLETSAGNHNALLGAKQELEALYKAATEIAPFVEEVVSVVDPMASPAVDATITAIEDVVSAL